MSTWTGVFFSVHFCGQQRVGSKLLLDQESFDARFRVNSFSDGVPLVQFRASEEFSVQSPRGR